MAEKIVDMEIEKEEGPLKEQLQQLQTIQQGQPIIKDNNDDETANQRLPPVGRAVQQPLKDKQEKGQSANHYPRSRYSSLREE